MMWEWSFIPNGSAFSREIPVEKFLKPCSVSCPGDIVSSFSGVWNAT